MYAEAMRYATSHGYGTDQLKVGFRYPVTWSVICPGTDTKTSRGEVHVYGGESLVEAKMYGPEFLAEMPITVEWRERSPIAGIVVAVCAVVLFGIVGIVIYLAGRSRLSRNRRA